MALHRITTVDTLHRYLYAALQLEHATIPPYLTALYSIRPGTNADAYHVLRVTAVEEMLHLTLAANILNAVGGKPDLTKPGFVPEYPAYLPDGEADFQVSRGRFSRDALETFLSIERPRQAPDEASRLLDRCQPRRYLSSTTLPASVRSWMTSSPAVRRSVCEQQAAAGHVSSGPCGATRWRAGPVDKDRDGPPLDFVNLLDHRPGYRRSASSPSAEGEVD